MVEIQQSADVNEGKITCGTFLSFAIVANDYMSRQKKRSNMRKGRKERKKLFPKPQSARVKTEGGKVPLSEKVYRSRNSLLTSFWVCHSKKGCKERGEAFLWRRMEPSLRVFSFFLAKET